jgi:L-rhamnono-1,4-lactonase
MTPDHFLAKRHGIQDYLTVASPKPDGFIYVETDRYLPSTTPSTSGSASTLEAKSALETYAKEPLSEVRFLRRIVEGKTTEGDGCDATLQQGTLMKGCVIWAPFHLSPPLFQTYLALAEEVAGPTLWPKVVGFRYLLQGKPPGEVASLLQSAAWMENICALGKGRGGKGWTFDVGVDTNRDGVEMLEEAGSMIQRVREKEKQERGNAKPVRFVISTFSPPPLFSHFIRSFYSFKRFHRKLN